MKNSLRIKLMACILVALPSLGQSQVAYEYDERGRLKEADYDSGKVIEYSYDDAGNRTEVKTTGTGQSDPDPMDFGGGGVIVVPLNGFTIIPLN